MEKFWKSNKTIFILRIKLFITVSSKNKAISTSNSIKLKKLLNLKYRNNILGYFKVLIR